MAVIWNEIGPWGYRADLPGGVVAVVTRRGTGNLFRWYLTHPDLHTRAQGAAATIAEARADILAAAEGFALTLADALDARAALLTARATACRNWVAP